MTELRAHLAEAERQLREYGLLLVQDPRLPCVTTIVAGRPLRGSWLANPRPHDTYRVLHALHDDPDVLHTKLVSGKVTLVHRELWPAVVAVAVSRSAWQLEGLPPLADWLLGQVDTDRSVQTDIVPLPSGALRKRIADAARELERRLLVHAEEIHTPSGAHAKLPQTWPRWLAEHPLGRLPSVPTGRLRLEQAMARINREFGGAGRLPWPSAPPPAPPPAPAPAPAPPPAAARRHLRR